MHIFIAMLRILLIVVCIVLIGALLTDSITELTLFIQVITLFTLGLTIYTICQRT